MTLVRKIGGATSGPNLSVLEDTSEDRLVQLLTKAQSEIRTLSQDLETVQNQPEVVIEVPVEHEVVVEKIVEVEKVLEKIVEVPVETVVEITKEVPVEVEVEKEIVVEVEVEKEVKIQDPVLLQVVAELELENQKVQESLEEINRKTSVALQTADLRILALETTLEQAVKTSERRGQKLKIIEDATVGRWPFMLKRTIRSIL